jgi:hypothetical protein
MIWFSLVNARAAEVSTGPRVGTGNDHRLARALYVAYARRLPSAVREID